MDKIKWSILGVMAAMVTACASPDPETKYIIIRQQAVDSEFSRVAADYCARRGQTAVRIVEEDNDVTFFCE